MAGWLHTGLVDVQFLLIEILGALEDWLLRIELTEYNEDWVGTEQKTPPGDEGAILSRVVAVADVDGGELAEVLVCKAKIG